MIVKLRKKIVSKRYPSEGPRYLEKIVQAPFDIPYPLRLSLLNVFEKSVKGLMQGSKELEYWKEYQDSDYCHFRNLFDDVMAPQIESPRDIIRIMNALKVSWHAVAGEVDPADFAALETLRIQQPSFHAILKANKQKLTGNDQMSLYQESLTSTGSSNSASPYEEVFLVGFPNEIREERKRALSLLFPPLDSVWEGSGTSSSSSDRDNWKRQRRVCCPEHFDTYFRFSLSPETISIEEVIKTSNSGDKNYIKNAILEASRKSNGSRTYASILLEELRVHANRIPIEKSTAFLSGLFSAYIIIDDKLNESRDMIWTDVTNRIYSLLERLLLYRTTLEKRSAIISETIRYAGLRFIAIVSRQEYWNYHPPQDITPEPPEKRLMTESDAEDMRQIFITKVRTAAEDESLFKERNFYFILGIYEQLSDNFQNDKIKSCCLQKLDKDANVEIFAKEFLESFEKYEIIIVYRLFDMQILSTITGKLVQRVNEVLSYSERDGQRYTILKRFKEVFEESFL